MSVWVFQTQFATRSGLPQDDSASFYFCVSIACIYVVAKAVTLLKVEGSLGQGPATEVTHCGLNQPPIFSSDLCM